MLRNNSLLCIDLYLLLPNSHRIDIEINRRSHVVNWSVLNYVLYFSNCSSFYFHCVESTFPSVFPILFGICLFTMEYAAVLPFFCLVSISWLFDVLSLVYCSVSLEKWFHLNCVDTMSDTHFLCFSEQSNCASVFVGNADPSELFS